jgi:tetratricopeptide (TPR) repeat protein
MRLNYLETERQKGFPTALFEYDTDHNHAWYLRGLAFEKLGNRTEAASCFLVAIEVWPDDADSYVAYSNTEDDLEAITEVLERGVVRTDDERIRFNLANTYLDLNLPERAVSHANSLMRSGSTLSGIEETLETAKRAIEEKTPVK